MYSIYILQCSDNTLYTGIATDLAKRLEVHRSGKGSKYVRTRLPFFLVYEEKSPSRSEASKREYEIKQLDRTEKFKLIEKYNMMH